MAVKSAEKQMKQGKGPRGCQWGCQWGRFSEQTLEAGRSHVVSGDEPPRQRAQPVHRPLRAGKELTASRPR